MSETTFRKYLGGLLKECRAHVSQVESHETSAGIPDTNYCIGGIDGWIECKFAAAGRKNKVIVRKSQKVWFRDRLKVGAKRCFVAVRWETKGTVWNVIRKVASREELNNTDPMWWLENAHLLWESGNPPDSIILTRLLIGDSDAKAGTDAPRAW